LKALEEEIPIVQNDTPKYSSIHFRFDLEEVKDVNYQTKFAVASILSVTKG